MTSFVDPGPRPVERAATWTGAAPNVHSGNPVTRPAKLTETDLQTLRIIVSITAMRMLLRECLVEFAGASPERAYRCWEMFARLRSKPLSLRGIDPTLIDLAENEYQEALEELLSYVESGLRSDPRSARPLGALVS